MNVLTKLTGWYFTKRAIPYWCILILDCAIIVFSGLLGHLFEFGGRILLDEFWPTLLGLLVCLPVYIICFHMLHTYKGIIRYSSYVELFRLSIATAAASAFIGFIGHFTTSPYFEIPDVKSAIILFVISTLLMWMMRLIVKASFESINTKDSLPVAIYGTKAGGIALANSIRSIKKKTYTLKAFITDGEEMRDTYLLGQKVYFNEAGIGRDLKRLGIKVLLVSPMKSEKFRDNLRMIDEIMQAGIKIMMMPAAEEWDGKSTLTHQNLHEVDIEDLLPRDKIEVDMDAIGSMLSGKRVLITGAAGSIGSEMVRQVAPYKPAEMILVDQAETPMHDIRLMMARQFPDVKNETIVASITDKVHMEMLFSEHRPEYVFHAAAYKHVPMMENNPAQAVRNNINGTRVIADLAVKYGTKKFVMISTDKAVNPTNVMGCSKRICEIYCQALNKAIVDLQNNLTSGVSDYQTSVADSCDSSNSCSSKEIINDKLTSKLTVINVKEEKEVFTDIHVPIHGNSREEKNNQTSGVSDFQISKSTLCQFDGSLPVTQFVTTRFGNVLGSNGSVIPLFREQIKKGGPLTVTHPDIIRFFMLIPEACKLVLEAGTMGKGGEIFVFDMGKPVKIVDLAKRMIQLSGAKNIDIKFTGLRDGEKLYEELLATQENTKPTHHPKIMIAQVRSYDYEVAKNNEDELLELSYSHDDMKIVKKMKEIVPEFKSKHSKYEALDK